ncbi:tRNA dimethylallyltransferase [Exophiala dermatitidis]
MVLRRLSSTMASHPPKDPIVVVIGATGTGKSKLAVQLATRFNGEIINGDAMQMYKGLPITTNKMPDDERNGIPHHLLDFIGLDENPWTVNRFVKESSRLIDEVRSRGKLPIVVGGTHYYTHALLFKEATLTDETGDNNGPDGGISEPAQEDHPMLSRPTEELFAKLQEIDPDMAARWHPNDRRKIQRSLQIWLQTGRKASDVYAEQQRRTTNGHGKGGEGNDIDGATQPANSAQVEEQRLRYPTLLLWLEAEDRALKERLNARVDVMVANGLADEAASMTRLEADLRSRGIPVDKTKGIWVSIGYKEMEPWIQSQQSLDSDSSHAGSSRGLQDAIESVKAGTRRYAKRQNRYIRIRLANDLVKASMLDKLFLLDCSDLTHWDSAVEETASKLVASFLSGRALPDPRSISNFAERMLPVPGEGESQAKRTARRCEVCDKVLMTDAEWNGHLASRGHKKTVAAHRKRDLAGSKAGHEKSLPEGPGG